jgi:polyisoprenoid-binding protein YceI
VSAPTTIATGRYALVPTRCTVRFTARGFGLPVPGALSVRSGEVTIDDEGATVTAVLDAATFRTRNARRDRDVRSRRFLDVERHPDILFTGQWAGPGSPLRGFLGVRSVAVPIDVEIGPLEAGARGVTVRGSARVDRRAFSVGPGGPGPIGRWVDVELEIALLPS